MADSSNLAEDFFNAFGDALSDIRTKAVEEPWFGRAVTEPGEALEWPKAEEPAFEPQGLTGEVLGPEPEMQSYPASDTLLERGQIIDNESPSWPEARDAEPSQSLEDHSQDIDLDL